MLTYLLIVYILTYKLGRYNNKKKGMVYIMLNESRKSANKQHVAKLDNIMIRPYKDEGTVIRAAAGKSVQAYVLDAVCEKMKREGSCTVSDGKGDRG